MAFVTFGFSSAKKLLLALIVFVASNAHAYIPSSRTIAGRVAHNNGKGVIAIDEEVQFRTTTEPLILHERWVIENGDKMRLTVTSPKSTNQNYRFEAVYINGKRTATDLHGAIQASPVSQEFIEKFFHTRSGKGFLDELVRTEIVPGSFLRERPHSNSKDNPTPLPEPLVRLARTGGIVSYAFGDPTAVDAKRASSGMWIEQDAFVVRKLRFPSEAEVTADHTMQGTSLKFPRDRTVNWANNSVLIRVLSIKNVNAKQAAAFVNASALTSADAKAAHLPDQPQVEEFYSRFR